MAIKVKSVLYKESVYIYFSKHKEPVRIPTGIKANKLLESGYLGKTSGVEDFEVKNEFIRDKIKEVEQGIKDYPKLTAGEFKLFFKKGILPNAAKPEETKQLTFLEAFEKLYTETANGNRLSKEGTKININTIKNYRNLKVCLNSFGEYWLKEKYSTSIELDHITGNLS